MTFDQFQALQDALLADCRQMAGTKGKEYAGGDERFGNFNRLSQSMGVSREVVCFIYLSKHMDAIASYLRDPSQPLSEPIRGRIVDAVTYLTLLAGMIQETSDAKVADHVGRARARLEYPNPLEEVRQQFARQTQQDSGLIDRVGESAVLSPTAPWPPECVNSPVGPPIAGAPALSAGTVIVTCTCRSGMMDRVYPHGYYLSYAEVVREFENNLSIDCSSGYPRTAAGSHITFKHSIVLHRNTIVEWCL